MLRVTRRSAVKARTQVANRPGSLVATAPDPVRYQLPDLHTRAQTNLCAALRPRTATTTTAYAKRALRHLARRYQTLDTEVSQINTEIRRLCVQANPALLATPSRAAPDTAAALRPGSPGPIPTPWITSCPGPSSILAEPGQRRQGDHGRTGGANTGGTGREWTRLRLWLVCDVIGLPVLLQWRLGRNDCE